MKVPYRIILTVCFCLTITKCVADDSKKDWWEHATVYQIYPRSFADSDGDGIGDLPGITSKLSHLNDIGVNTIWMSPIFQSPQKDFGYDVSDFYAIHHEYGTMKDFEEFLKEAKKRNINVLLDFVPNHSSDQCEWFKKSVRNETKFDDYYVWHNGKVLENGTRLPPNNWRSVFGGSAWTWNDQRQQFYFHQFLPEQPDLNYRNKKVAGEMEKVLSFWLEKGVAGFRIDAINHMFEDAKFRDEPRNEWNTDPNSYDYLNHIYTKDLDEDYDMVYNWRSLLDNWTNKHKTNKKMLVIEAYANMTNTMRYYKSEEDRLGGIPFNFGLVYLSKGVIANQIKVNVENWFNYMPKGHAPNWVVGSHDHSRVATKFGPEFIPIMNTLNLLLPGISFTYYGEEIGMEDHKNFPIHDSRDPNRTPMQWDDSTSAGFSKNTTTWLPVHPNYKSINVALAKSANRSHLHHFRELTNLRREETIINGNISLLVPDEHVLTFTREYPNNPMYVVIINLNERNKTVDLEMFDNLKGKPLNVAASASSSNYRIGDAVNATNFNIQGYDAIVLRTASGAYRILATGLLWLSFLLVFLYQTLIR